MLSKSDYTEQFYHGGGTIGGYDDYSEETYASEPHAKIAEIFQDKLGDLGISISGKQILVCGCAFGFLVKHLCRLGAEAYGLDISTYAVSQVPEEIRGRVIVGDVCDPVAFESIRLVAGGGLFDYIVDEDMLACLTDSEALVFKDHALSHGKMLLHLLEADPGISAWYNYKPVQEWKVLLSANSINQRFYTRFGVEEK